MVEERRKDGNLLERVIVLETQMGRLVSDAESEKDTRRRVSESIEKRFVVGEDRVRSLEHTIWKASGAMAVIVSVIVLVVNLVVKHI